MPVTRDEPAAPTTTQATVQATAQATVQAAVQGTVQAAYVLFEVQVSRLQRLSPSFLRVTFAGPELNWFADNGADQRIKLVLPTADGAPLTLPPAAAGTIAPDDWYAYWLSLPSEVRNPIRTYTVRRVRAEQVEVDFVLHGDHGPASRWAGAVSVGDRAQLVGPNARYVGSTRAASWNPPASAGELLIVGDETAMPAIAAILEGLPADARGTALIEIPEPDDAIGLAGPAGVRVEWLPRSGSAHGELLSAATRRVAGQLLTDTPAPMASLNPALDAVAGRNPAVDAVAGRNPTPTAVVGRDPALVKDSPPDDSTEALWDVPEPAEQPAVAPVYAWLAGEARCIAGLRRHLVKELGLDRRSVAFMGYWRAGKAEYN